MIVEWYHVTRIIVGVFQFQFLGHRQTQVPHQTRSATEKRGGHPAKPLASGRGEFGTHVRNARAHFRRDGKAEGRHAGNDFVAREGPAHRASHQISNHSDSDRPQALAQQEHRALRLEAGKCAFELGRRISPSETVRFRIRPDHRGEVVSEIRRGHARLLG